jgi:hypothetical protein
MRLYLFTIPLHNESFKEIAHDATLLPKRLNSFEIVPLCNESVKELAQQCVRAGQGGVYIKHFRKAGGTAVKAAMAKEICQRGMQDYSSELPFFNPETLRSWARKFSLLSCAIQSTASCPCIGSRDGGLAPVDRNVKMKK